MLYKIGITGQTGFIGSHLYRYLNLDKNRFLSIPFEDGYFANQSQLNEWVGKCDVIVHLAALSRHEELSTVYNTNILLVKKLIDSLDKTRSKPHIIFSSSIQEDNNSEYGKSKKEGRQLLAEWCKKNNAPFTGLILPNVYGPCARPGYASFIATFSYQLTHNEVPKVIVDSKISLIYVNDLIKIIAECIYNRENNPKYYIPHTDRKKVSDILKQLEYYRECYIENNIIPSIKNPFDCNLFNTFKSYISH